MSTYPQSDDPNYPSSSGFYSDLYGSLLPDPQTLYNMARNSYVSPQNPEKMIARFWQAYNEEKELFGLLL